MWPEHLTVYNAYPIQIYVRLHWLIKFVAGESSIAGYSPEEFYKEYHCWKNALPFFCQHLIFPKLFPQNYLLKNNQSQLHQADSLLLVLPVVKGYLSRYSILPCKHLMACKEQLVG